MCAYMCCGRSSPAAAPKPRCTLPDWAPASEALGRELELGGACGWERLAAAPSPEEFRAR